MQHQEGCPLRQGPPAGALDGSNVKNLLNGADVQNEAAAPCPDRRCSTWLDLSTWFSYKGSSLPGNDFQRCFTDLGHGGKGVFERLAVLGQKGLQMLAFLHVSEQFCYHGIPFDLQRLLSEDLLRRLWTMKRVERVCSTRALIKFGRSYLATAQTMDPGTLAIARYVRALTGFAVQTHGVSRTPLAEGRRFEIEASANDNQVPRETAVVYEWAAVLIDNIYWVQKLKTEYSEVHDELVQDLQEYFGYPYDTLIPRIHNILRAQATGTTTVSGTDTGVELLKILAVKYFMNLATHSSLGAHEVDKWLETEVNIFMRSRVFAIFASTHLNLTPFLEKSSRDEKHLPGSEKYEQLFFQLLGACYAVTREKEATRAMNGLMQRLRQIQLILHMEEIDVEMNGPLHLPLATLQGIDIFRWSTIANWDKNFRGRLWTNADRIPHLEAFLPSSTARQRRRLRQKETQYLADEKSENLLNIPHCLRQMARSLAPCIAAPLTALKNSANPSLTNPGRRHNSGANGGRNGKVSCVGVPLHLDAPHSFEGGGAGRDREEYGEYGGVAEADRDRENGDRMGGGDGFRGDGFRVQVPVLKPGTNEVLGTATQSIRKRGDSRGDGPAASAVRDAQTNEARRLAGQVDGLLWRPPGASFIRPRVVRFNRGEAYVSPHMRTPFRDRGGRDEGLRLRPGEVNVNWCGPDFDRHQNQAQTRRHKNHHSRQARINTSSNSQSSTNTNTNTITNTNTSSASNCSSCTSNSNSWSSSTLGSGSGSGASSCSCSDCLERGLREGAGGLDGGGKHDEFDGNNGKKSAGRKERKAQRQADALVKKLLNLGRPDVRAMADTEMLNRKLDSENFLHLESHEGAEKAMSAEFWRRAAPGGRGGLTEVDRKMEKWFGLKMEPATRNHDMKMTVEAPPDTVFTQGM